MSFVHVHCIFFMYSLRPDLHDVVDVLRKIPSRISDTSRNPPTAYPVPLSSPRSSAHRRSLAPRSDAPPPPTSLQPPRHPSRLLAYPRRSAVGLGAVRDAAAVGVGAAARGRAEVGGGVPDGAGAEPRLWRRKVGEDD